MIVVAAVAGLGVLAGAAAAMIAWRWSRVDPTDPHLERRTVRRVLRDHPVLARVVRRFHPRPATGTAEVLGAAAVAVVVGAAAAGALLIMIRTRSGVARADTPLAEWAAANATTASTEVMRAISDLGGTAVVVGVALALGAFELLRDRRPAALAFIALTIGGQFLLSNGIKFVVDRARPAIAPLTGFSGASFPSGHSVAAAATWACAAFVLGLHLRRHGRAVLLGASVAVAVAVAATRVALGVHWTTDVIAGLMVGWAWFALCAVAFGGRLLDFGRPIEVAEQEVGVAVPGGDQPASPSRPTG